MLTHAPKKKSVKMWPVDTSVFNPVQPNYISKPLFVGCPDPVPFRSGLWVGDNEAFTPPPIIDTRRGQWRGGASSSAAPLSKRGGRGAANSAAPTTSPGRYDG